MKHALGRYREVDLMGTVISVELADALPGSRLDGLMDQTFAWFREVDDRFSPFKPDSEVSRLDRGEVALADCSPDMRKVVETCGQLWAETSCYFDVYATGHFDPCGYVKGWAVQVASDRLAEAGAVNHCVNAGGDLRVRGHQADGSLWRVGILHPWRRPEVAWVLEATDLAVATSGTYQRGLHVIDPFTGTGSDYLRSVTVVGPDLGVADAYATAAVAMGRPALHWLAGLDGHEAGIVMDDRSSYVSAGLPLARPTDAAPLTIS
jgi:thiamine biosynthesis lipoprotein